MEYGKSDYCLPIEYGVVKSVLIKTQYKDVRRPIHKISLMVRVMMIAISQIPKKADKVPTTQER